MYKSAKFRPSFDSYNNVATLAILVDYMDAGKYRCEVSNRQGRAETSCRLTVNVPPTVDFDNRYLGTQEVKAGSTLILPVNFAAAPAPRVTWYRNGVPLQRMPGHIHIDNGEGYSTLTVMGIEQDEGGNYEVVVENSAGSDKTDFHVAVKCKYKITSSGLWLLKRRLSNQIECRYHFLQSDTPL